MLPEITVDVTQVVPGYRIPWISLRPEFVGLARLFQVAGNIMVETLDGKLLALAHALAQLVRLPRALRPEGSLPETVIAVTERRVSHGEIRVEANPLWRKGIAAA